MSFDEKSLQFKSDYINQPWAIGSSELKNSLLSNPYCQNNCPLM